MRVLSPRAAGIALGVAPSIVQSDCERFPGYAFRVGQRFKIPASHIERQLLGASPAEIAAEAAAKRRALEERLDAASASLIAAE